MGERGHLQLQSRPSRPPMHWGRELTSRPPMRKGPLLPSSTRGPHRRRKGIISGVSPQPFFGGSTSINQISGKITSGEEVLARLTGHWVRGRLRAGAGRPGGSRGHGRYL